MKNYQRLAALLTNPEHGNINVLPIKVMYDKVTYISWRLQEETVVASPQIAAFMMALARLKLYEHLELLDRQVLYYDTNSCKYICRFLKKRALII